MQARLSAVGDKERFLVFYTHQFKYQITNLKTHVEYKLKFICDLILEVRRGYSLLQGLLPAIIELLIGKQDLLADRLARIRARRQIV